MTVRVLMVRLPDGWDCATIEEARAGLGPALAGMGYSQAGPALARLEGGYTELGDAAWQPFRRAYDLRARRPKVSP